MKKWIAAVAALMMILVCTAAPAEEESMVNPEAFQLYDSEWVDAGMYVKIYAEEDHWKVWINTWDETVEWDYSCLFDETDKTLKTDGSFENTKHVITIDEEGSEINQNLIYDYGEAVFSLNEDGKLIWDDRTEHAGEGHVFEKIGWFQGLWISGEDADTRYDLDCCWDIEEPAEGEVNSGYKIEIERHEGESYTHWMYSCIYKAEENKLISFFGQKEFAEKAGEPPAVVYEDGEAEFTIDDEGCIRWDDLVENAGDGLQFAPTNG